MLRGQKEEYSADAWELSQSFVTKIVFLCYPAKFWPWSISIVLLSVISNSHTGKTTSYSSLLISRQAAEPRLASCKSSPNEGSSFLVERRAEGSPKRCTELCIFITAEMLWGSMPLFGANDKTGKEKCSWHNMMPKCVVSDYEAVFILFFFCGRVVCMSWATITSGTQGIGNYYVGN